MIKCNLLKERVR